MIGLILTIVLGLVIAFISIKSTSDIALTIGNYTYFNIPLYAITVGVYALGLLLAWIIEVPQAIATAFQIMGLGRSVRSGKNTIVELKNKIIKLEIENSKLHDRNQSIITNRQSVEPYKPTIIQNFLHRLNIK